MKKNYKKTFGGKKSLGKLILFTKSYFPLIFVSSVFLSSQNIFFLYLPIQLFHTKFQNVKHMN